MEHLPFLQDLVIVTVLAVAVALFLGGLKLPTVTALLVAGALAGPHGLGLVRDVHTIDVLSEVGIVLLLFSIGLEFSGDRLRSMGKVLFLGGTLQVGLTGAAAFGIALLFGEPWPRAVFFGFVAALSSTAIGLKSLGRDELDTPYGRVIVGALIFQDLLVVPMMLALPVLAGQGGAGVGSGLLWALARAGLLIGLSLLAARFVVPRLFQLIDRSKSSETFLLAVVAICIGTAWASSLAGLSLALGAFLAGMVLAGSMYAHRALVEVLPLRDVLTSLFFMSLGMMFEPQVVLERPGEVALLFVGLHFGKGLMATVAALALRMPMRIALLAGAGLAQFGEFGFVLVKVAADTGLVPFTEVRALLAAGVLTMVVTPTMLRLAHHFAPRMADLGRGAPPAGPPQIALQESDRHVVVGGYGVAGQVLVNALRRCGVPVHVIELNADTVRRLRREDIPCSYGDIAQPLTLSHAGADRALALVLLINDPMAAERAVAAAHHYAPGTPIFVRVRYLRDAPRLAALGAAHVVADEVEAGVEMLAQVLHTAGVSKMVWLEHVASAREQTLDSVRDPTHFSRSLHELAEDVRVERVVLAHDAYAVGRTIADLHVRHRTSALIVAVRREGVGVYQVDPQFVFQDGDVVYLMGDGSALEAARLLLARGGIETGAGIGD